MLKFFTLLITMILAVWSGVSAQSKKQYVRIARLEIDSSQVKPYQQALKEHAEIAVKIEPGVIMLYAVYEKDHPSSVTVFEIYADEHAYQYHIKTAHFLRYKETVEKMVLSLKLIDVTPIALEMKKGVSN